MASIASVISNGYRKEEPYKGDLIGIYGNNYHNYRVAIYLGDGMAVLIYEQNQYNGIKHRTIEKIRNRLSRGIDIEHEDFSKEELMLLFKLKNQLDYIILHLNVITTPIDIGISVEEFLDVHQENFEELNRLQLGDIVSINGELRILGFNVYEHHVIYSDVKKCKAIHKWGEPDKMEILYNLVGKNMEGVLVREDNLLEVAFCRRIRKNNVYDADERFASKIRSPNKIVTAAKERIGESTYNVATDNCQHFCTYCRYGESISFQIENVKTAAVYGGLALGAAVLAGCLISKLSNKEKEKKNTNSQILE